MRVIYSSLSLRKLDAIQRYSVENFGMSVADNYMQDLNDVIHSITDKTHSRQIQNFLVTRARQHVIAYEIYQNHIIVIDILGQRQDIENHIAEAVDDIADELYSIRSHIKWNTLS